MSSPVAAAHHQHHHSVPFGVLPTHHSQLSHGFGLGFGFNAAQPQPPLLPLPLSVPVPSQEYHHQHSQQSQHSRRRRRSPSIDSSDDDNNQPAHSATASVKRTKLNSATSLSNQELSHTPQLSSTDLGKALGINITSTFYSQRADASLRPADSSLSLSRRSIEQPLCPEKVSSPCSQN
ncbi:hypothetical protein T439DRAFT_127921 [Meredithblackwellia eburnea MCA 4105]